MMAELSWIEIQASRSYLLPVPHTSEKRMKHYRAILMRIPALILFLTLCNVDFDIHAADTAKRREWKLDGVTREALVFAPPNAKTEEAPLVFAFHGHGGTMNNAARSFAYHTLWPAAIIVYPQGLNTPGRLTDPEGKKAGWQSATAEQGDRDLKFFDAMLESLKQEYKVDRKRIYATGHSNGGSFTYLLWAARGDVFAAVAPCATAAPRLMDQLKPKPVLHLAGENDPLVKFSWQKQTIDAVRKLDQCGEGKPWGENCTIYASKIGMPVVTFIHPGGHAVPPEAPATIVKFFKEQKL
jgi:polyhydroxybutyrate depolymerase